MERGLSTGTKLLLAIALIGAINWGLVGFFNWSLVTAIFGGATTTEMSAASRIVYAIVGICGVIGAFMTPWGRRLVSPVERVTPGSRAEVRP